MDQKRLFIAIAISIAILLGFQMVVRPHLPQPPAGQAVNTTVPAGAPASAPGASQPVVPGALGADAAARQVPKQVPRVRIAGAKMTGSISLLGARIDDLVLNEYRETLEPNSPLVHLLEPRSEAQPYYVQYGWSNAPGTNARLPDNDTVWTASAITLTTGKPVTLSWDNGAGLTFEVVLSVDDNYMFDVQQRVRNATGAPVSLHPWSRIRRDYKPETSGYSVLFEGLVGVAGGTLQETSYEKAKSEGEKHAGIAFDSTGAGGWAGITDKYWLTALIPDQTIAAKTLFQYVGQGSDAYQVGYTTEAPQTIAPGANASVASHLFAGAKLVALLDKYEADFSIPHFDKAVDFGWFYFLTKPIFFALDWLNAILGNFGLAILVFTVCVKGLFFPLANYSYRSMSRMKLLAPKMQSLRELYKDDPQRLQKETMGLYKAEKVNPASGCLPMLVQIPVFFSLYKVILITIEMRQAPFFGWIKDLSQVDQTNVFNLFGLIPFDPSVITPYLHLGAWPLIMGVTMYLQQKMNPPPPDPVQAKVFQFMPLIFMFMLANFPAGLVIYWSWNNTLSVAQQWLIQRRTSLPKPNLART
jgi:YidC/Oxa1 family membrane protein insertase